MHVAIAKAAREECRQQSKGMLKTEPESFVVGQPGGSRKRIEIAQAEGAGLFLNSIIPRARGGVCRGWPVWHSVM